MDMFSVPDSGGAAEKAAKFEIDARDDRVGARIKDASRVGFMSIFSANNTAEKRCEVVGHFRRDIEYIGVKLCLFECHTIDRDVFECLASIAAAKAQPPPPNIADDRDLLANQVMHRKTGESPIGGRKDERSGI